MCPIVPADCSLPPLAVRRTAFSSVMLSGGHWGVFLPIPAAVLFADECDGSALGSGPRVTGEFHGDAGDFPHFGLGSNGAWCSTLGVLGNMIHDDDGGAFRVGEQLEWANVFGEPFGNAFGADVGATCGPGAVDNDQPFAVVAAGPFCYFGAVAQLQVVARDVPEVPILRWWYPLL